MKLDDKQRNTVDKAKRELRSWRVVRFLLLPVPVVLLVLGMRLFSDERYLGNPLGGVLVTLLLALGIGFSAFLFFSWDNEKTKLLVDLADLLEKDQDG